MPALLRDIASQAVTTLQGLRVPALVGPLDDDRVAVLLSQERNADADAVLGRLSERLHAVSERRSEARLVIGAGSTVRRHRAGAGHVAGGDAGDRDGGRPCRPNAPTSARPICGCAGSCTRCGPNRPSTTTSNASSAVCSTHDAEHGTRLVEFLAAYCRCGGNKTAAAAELFISRAALYDRIVKVERVLGVDLADPEVVVGLHFAVLARETMRRPDLAVVRG